MNTDTNKLKAGQLFTFIREFARLSQRPVESLDSYIKTFWLDQIPHEPECSFVAWAKTDTDEEETVIANWLAVERPERPDPPPVAEDLTTYLPGSVQDAVAAGGNAVLGYGPALGLATLFAVIAIAISTIAFSQRDVTS